MNTNVYLIGMIIMALSLHGCNSGIGNSISYMEPSYESSRATTSAPNNGIFNENITKYNKISQEEAKAVVDGGGGYILLDVRTKEEYSQKHIVGAIHIPVDEIKRRAERELPDKDTLIMVYCRSGIRSINAAEILIELGYTNIYDIGGINSWPYETE